MINTSGIHRCSICNRVNNEYIETELGDYAPMMSFTEDPSNKLFDICVECSESINEQLLEWESEDE